MFKDLLVPLGEFIKTLEGYVQAKLWEDPDADVRIELGQIEEAKAMLTKGLRYWPKF